MNKSILSLLMLGSLATSTMSIKAEKSILKTITKAAKYELNFAKENFGDSVRSALVRTAAIATAEAIIKYLVVAPYEKIKSFFITKDEGMYLSKEQLDKLQAYINALQEKADRKDEVEETTKEISSADATAKP